MHLELDQRKAEEQRIFNWIKRISCHCTAV